MLVDVDLRGERGPAPPAEDGPADGALHAVATVDLLDPAAALRTQLPHGRVGHEPSLSAETKRSVS